MNRNEKRVMESLLKFRDAHIEITNNGYGRRYMLWSRRRLNYIADNDLQGWANHMGTGQSISVLYKVSYVNRRTFHYLLENNLICKATLLKFSHIKNIYCATENVEKYKHIWIKSEEL